VRRTIHASQCRETDSGFAGRRRPGMAPFYVRHSMKGHLLASDRARRFAIATVLLVVMAIGTCAFFRISRPVDIEAYFGMATECHPVWRAFALRRLSAGDPASELLSRFPPSRRDEFGRYGVYDYNPSPDSLGFSGLRVVTRDGKLLTAESGSCTWHFTFFRTEDSDLDAQYAAYCEERRARRERERSERDTKIGEPDGAANGSQPVRSETNRTSSAAGSRR
jgi:hypothetical protein